MENFGTAGFLLLLLLCNLFSGGSGLAQAPEALPSGTPPADNPVAERPPTDPPPLQYLVTVEEEAVDIAGSVDIQTAEELQLHRMVRTLPESLQLVPGVLAQKTAHGQGSPFLRGFTGFRTLLLIDGIRLNNSVFRDGPNQYWNTVDPLTIRQLEVIKGPSSVLFGSDAIGGTVNTVTRGRETFSEETTFQGRLFQRVSSAENSYVGRLELSGNVGRRLGFFLGGSFKDFGDLQGGSQVGRQPNTGYDELDGDFRLDFFPRPGTQLVVAHQTVDLDDVWRTHRTPFGISWEGTEVGNERRRVLSQDRHLTFLQFSDEHLLPFADRFKVSLSHQVQKEKRDRIRSNGRKDVQGFDVGSTGLFARLESGTRLGRWTYGFEVYHDGVDSFRDDFNSDGTLRRRRIQGPVADDSSYDTFGLYLEDRIEAMEQVDFLLGARYTHARVHAGQVEDPVSGEPFSFRDSWNQVVASARAMVHLRPDERLNLFGGVSQGFRAPNLSDLTRLDTARSNELEVASPGLDPETFVSYEVGLKSEYFKWSTQVAYFYTDIRNLIVRAPTGRRVEDSFEVIKKNSGGGFVQGLELEAAFSIHPQLTASLLFAAMDGEVDTFPTSQPVQVREPMDRLYPTSGAFGLEWKDLQGKLWMGGILRMSARQDRLSTRDRLDTQRIPPGGTPGYVVVDLQGGWQLNPFVGFSVLLENLTNEDYRIHGSGLNEAGRNLVLGLDLRF